MFSQHTEPADQEEEMSRSFIIGVDFDGTIVDHRFPDIGTPCPGAIEWLQRFIKVGAKIVLWTMRSDNQNHGNVLSDAVNFLSQRGIELYGVNHNPTQDSWTSSPKAYCHLYIDDAAFGCPLMDNPRAGGKKMVDWSIVGPAVYEMIVESMRAYS